MIDERVYTAVEAYRAALATLYDGATTDPTAPLTQQPLRVQFAYFARLGTGTVDRASVPEAVRVEVEHAVDHLLHLLSTPPDLPLDAPWQVQNDLWIRSPLGRLLAAVCWWLYHDDFMTITEAATLIFGRADPVRMQQELLAKGVLRAYIDPHERNSQKARRVRRSDVAVFMARDVAHTAAAAPTVLSPAEIARLVDDDHLSFAEIGRRIGKTRETVRLIYRREKQARR